MFGFADGIQIVLQVRCDIGQMGRHFGGFSLGNRYKVFSPLLPIQSFLLFGIEFDIPQKPSIFQTFLRQFRFFFDQAVEELCGFGLVVVHLCAPILRDTA